jgi:hypothetical protein
MAGLSFSKTFPNLPEQTGKAKPLFYRDGQDEQDQRLLFKPENDFVFILYIPVNFVFTCFIVFSALSLL